jgi:hypothetical protein
MKNHEVIMISHSSYKMTERLLLTFLAKLTFNKLTISTCVVKSLFGINNFYFRY